MPLPHLPDLPPSVPPRDDLDAVANRLRGNIAGTNTVIPWTYGRDRVWGRFITAFVDEVEGFYYISYGFCRGPIGEIEKVFIDDVDVDDPTDGFLAKYAADGAEINRYTGTAVQGVDPLLEAVIEGYTDTNPNTAYIVIKFPTSSISGLPRVEAIVKGSLLYDPRLDDTNGGVGDHRLDDESTREYFDNPGLAHANFTYFAAGIDVHWDSVAELANFDDEIVGTGPAAEKRRLIGLTMERPEEWGTWNSAFRVYSGCFTVWENGKLRFIPDRKDAEAPGSLLFNRGKSSGSYNRLTGAHHAAINFTTGDFTIEGWINPDSLAANGLIFGKYHTSGAHWRLGVSSTAALRMVISDGTDTATPVATAASLGTEDWQHVAAVVNRTTDLVYFYVNGVFVSSSSIVSVTGSLANASATPRVGAIDASTEPFIGFIDEIRVWNYALTAEEIEEAKDFELAGDETGLVAYYRMNEGIGTVVGDSTSNDNDLAFSLDPFWYSGYEGLLPYGVVAHFGPDDIIPDSLDLTKRGVSEAPSVMTVEYTDAHQDRWFPDEQEAVRPGVEEGTISRRESRISLPGIHRASQAKREATERLNKLMNDLSGRIGLYDVGAKLLPGSIIQISHPIGLSYKMFRVLALDVDSGHYVIDIDEYDPAAYSDEVIETPTFPDTNLGNPLNPPMVTGATVVEELYQQKNGDVSSRLKVTWTASKYPFLSQYVVEGYLGDELKVSVTTTGPIALLAGIDELVDDEPIDFTVKIYIESPFVRGSPVIETVAIEGKLLPPGNVPSVAALQTDGGTARVSWGRALDIDIWRYEVRQGAVGVTWESATFVQLVDGLEMVFTGLAVGSHRVLVKAIDSVRNYSEVATHVDFNIVAPGSVAYVSGYEVAAEVRLSWPAASGFVNRYKITYGPTTGGDEQVIDITDSLRLSTSDVPEGTWRFYVRSMDKDGNLSTSAAYIDIVVTSDAEAFLVDQHDFVNPSVTNMDEYQIEDGDVLKTYYVTDLGDSFDDTSFQDMASNELASFHSSGDSEWLSETKDFGIELTGNFLVSLPGLQEAEGTTTKVLELSNDEISWDEYPSLSAKGTYRYARVRLSTTGSATMQVVTPLGVAIKVNVVPLEETGEANSNTSGATTITLDREYAFAKEIQLQPTGQGNMDATYDNLVLGSPSSFDVYIYDKFGQLIAVPFRWKFKGV